MSSPPRGLASFWKSERALGRSHRAGVPLLLLYDPSPQLGEPLKQGEVLRDVWEYRALRPPTPPDGEGLAFKPIHRPFTVVMTRYCDLFQDHRKRAKIRVTPEEVDLKAPQILLCEAFEETEIRQHRDGMNSRAWRDVTSNQKARYHHLPEASISTGANVPSLTLDFTRILTLPVDYLYRGVQSETVLRVAALPDVVRESLIQRFASFMSQVSLPEEGDETPPVFMWRE